ncbi:shikimate dehydrogenase [Candidatus Blochmannia ocreatus (nom. nud.)]|uniref:shikimate dehydrogenase (NADP(+)) n=1 Tax=Candidatus Blochmannia ocreatus (nom. nud.) TaxID=251538 RepID=A0ABY4STJ6_9ENTR|nr:shikimate dehydrogenase [Candidatus Blochmannia ocreatus]URJ25295.1 shikimate dehydrogenase [Candidatus Blochmannia ocreatus]
MVSFAVFGNPIKHSKSAEIYALFAKEIGISQQYNLYLASKNNFHYLLNNFFKSDGLGANITAPFKEQAYFLCNKLTKRAKIACSVNTIKKIKNNILLGDNTDGIGLISDFKRLNWINKSNNHFDITETNEMTANILLIGAGGASKGIIPVLLTHIATGYHIHVVNRTFSTAEKLVNLYYNLGWKNISCIPLNKLFFDINTKYSLIINATTSSVNNSVPEIPPFVINPTTKCYDLFYQSQDTSFITWCKRHGAKYCSDGLGMLVEQAAHAFFLWHNILPNTNSVIHYLRSSMQI